MKAMILAAGRGERMRPLTDHTPKPLLTVGGRTLIDWHLSALASVGVDDVIVNVAWLGTRIAEYVGDGSAWGIRVTVSDEGATPLETGGGIRRVLPRLGVEPFWVINGDVWSDFDLRALPGTTTDLAHLVVVDNPPHHPDGDFLLSNGRLHAHGRGQRVTFAGIGCYSPRLFDDTESAPFRLAPLLRHAAERGRVAASYHAGDWFDVGTPERLRWLDGRLRVSPRREHGRGD